MKGKTDQVKLWAGLGHGGANQLTYYTVAPFQLSSRISLNVALVSNRVLVHFVFTVDRFELNGRPGGVMDSALPDVRAWLQKHYPDSDAALEQAKL